MTGTKKKCFDFVVMNPPYDRNLHLKFLERVIKVADVTVNVSPVRWLQDPFAQYNRHSDYYRFEDSILKHIKSLKMYTAKEASELFKVLFATSVGIYLCTEEGGYDYRYIHPIVKKIADKTMESNWVPYSQKDFYKRGCIQEKPYVLNVACMRTKESDDKVCVMCRSYENQLKTSLMKKSSAGVNGTHFEFDTEEERRNFYDCYTSDFMMLTYRFWKLDQHITSYKIPYFGDYTKPWTNKRFCEYFGITGFISDTEAEPGSEWEIILETMKKYA